jgi:starvation-inducible outer membrane lipoprotein
VYDALWESRGQPSARPGPGPWPVPSPQVQLAQVQTLTRWNDAKGRTGGEVLAVLDRAISRTILSLAALPAPPGASPARHDQETGHGRTPAQAAAEKYPANGSAAQS